MQTGKSVKLSKFQGLFGKPVSPPSQLSLHRHYSPAVSNVALSGNVSLLAYSLHCCRGERAHKLLQVVLYFYPSDGSPSCTKQAAAFTENFSAFKKAGAVGRPSVA